MGASLTHATSAEPEPIDWHLLTLILDSHDLGRPWSTGELTQRFLDPGTASDSLTRLQHNGLASKINGFLIPTLTALYCRQLERLARDPRQLQLPL